MKYVFFSVLLCCGTILFSQNNNPTVAPCDGKQIVCATSSKFTLCVNIVIDPSYSNLNQITSYTIEWGDGLPDTTINTIGGQSQPPFTHVYDLSTFYGTCIEKKEFYVTLYTNHTPSSIDQTNSIFKLIIKNPPIAKLSISDQVICLGQNTTISDISCPIGFYDSNWAFGDGMTLNNTLSSIHTYTSAGTFTVSHSVTNTCGTDSETASVTVLNLPVADVKVDSGALSGTPAVVCLGGGGFVKLDASISLNETSYMWSVTPASGWSWWPLSIPPLPLFVPTGPIARIRFTQPGTYTIKIKVDNDCEMPSEKTIEIKVVDAPQLSLNPQADECADISYSPIPPTAGATYTINGVVKSSFPVALSLAATPYIVVATLSNECGMQVRRDTFNLSPAQDVTITAPASNLTVCTSSAPVILTATPAGGNWSGSFISQSMGNTVFTPPNSPGVFTLKYMRGAGNCARFDEVMITVEQSYNLQLSPQVDGCNSLVYSPTPFDANVQYTINGAIQSSFPVALPVSNTPYIVSASVTNTCGLKLLADTFMVVAPVAVNIQSPGQDTVVCQNTASIPLFASPPGGNWSGSGISGPTGNQVFNPSATGTALLIYARGAGACERRDTIRVQVEEAYNLQLTPQMDDCISISYSPTPNDPNVTYTLNGSAQSQFPQTLAVSGTPYIVTATHVNVCGTKVLTDSFFVLSPTNVNILAPSDTIVCQNSGALSLSAEPPGGIWQGQYISGTVFSPAGGGIFPLIYIRGNGNCEKRDTTQVEVIAVNIEAGPDKSVCIADAAFALTNFNPASGGTWTGAGITNPSGNFDPGTAGIGGYVLNYSFIDPVLGCTFHDSMTVQVNPMPASDFAPPLATCIDEVIQFQNLSVSTFNVLWNFGDGQTSNLAQPTHTYSDTGTYTIKLTTTNEFGCSDMISRTIFVTEPPFAFFTPLPDSGCAVLPVNFQNDSYGWQTKYSWKFGNLQTDSLFTPGQVLLPGGTKDTFYIITLTATNLCAVRTWTDSILVHPLPIVGFGTTTDTICDGDFLLFANTTLGQPETFQWDFGNGQTSTDSLPKPMQYYTDSLYRTYTLRLIATNFCGSDTLEHDITVKPVDVKAFFNVPNLIGCEPYTVQFHNFATPGANVFWQFGDGNTSSMVNPQHTFQNPGIYKVTQKVTDGCGFDSTVAYITVLPAPEVSFVCLPQICKEADLSFTNTSPSPLSGVHWDFGDGDSSLLYNPTHHFNNAGISTVVLTGISSVNGCPAPFSLPVNVLELPNVNIGTDKPDGCVPLSVKFQLQAQGATYFEWNFGDGNTALGNMPSHTFNAPGQYEIHLEGIDLNGCRNDTLLRYITVHPIPTPAFTMQRDRLCGLPVVVDFTNHTPDAVGYTWDFGDMTGTSIVNDPKHSYPLMGDYLVQLIAENAFMCLDTAAQIFSAYAQPMADFSWDPEVGCAPLTVLFENLSTFSTSAYWTFSDGGHADTLSHTAHTFYNWGLHGAKLWVSHREVCFDSLALSDIIEVFPSPTANFSFEEIVTDPPSGMFEFTDLSIGAVRWLWEFGDGDSSTLQNPAHRFYSNGQKLVKLTVWGENECPDDTIRGVTPLPMHGLFIPNAFTPGLDNGDAALFQPKGVGLREFEIAVYSSYGQLLWTSNTEDLIDGQPGKGWDGSYKDTQIPQDVYTWQVKTAIFDDGTVWGGKKIGSVTLIR